MLLIWVLIKVIIIVKEFIIQQHFYLNLNTFSDAQVFQRLWSSSISKHSTSRLLKKICTRWSHIITISFFFCSIGSPFRDREYLGTVNQIKLNMFYAAVGFEGRAQLHLVCSQ